MDEYTTYKIKGTWGFSSYKCEDQENPPEGAVCRKWTFGDKEGETWEFQRESLKFVDIDSAEIVELGEQGEHLLIKGMIAGDDKLKPEKAALQIQVENQRGPTKEFLAFAQVAPNIDLDLPVEACVYVDPKESSFPNKDGREVRFHRKALWFRQLAKTGIEKSHEKRPRFTKKGEAEDTTAKAICEEHGIKFYFDGLPLPKRDEDYKGNVEYDFKESYKAFFKNVKDFCEKVSKPEPELAAAGYQPGDDYEEPAF